MPSFPVLLKYTALVSLNFGMFLHWFHWYVVTSMYVNTFFAHIACTAAAHTYVYVLYTDAIV